MTAKAKAGITVVISALALGVASPMAAHDLPPASLSAEARARLAELAAQSGKPRPATMPATMDARRAAADAIQREIGERMEARYGVTVEETMIAGVPVRIFTPPRPGTGAPTLMNLHGGGFVLDSGSLTENIPVAALTGYRVVAVLYRLSPEHRFPAAVDDALAVYRALTKQIPAHRIGLYGTSAGAILAPQLIARLRSEKLPLPGALGIFSGSGDFADRGDSATIFGEALPEAAIRAYAGPGDLADPMLSPARGRLDGWPPTLCITSSRDYLLSATANFCRKLDAAGGSARLTLFDGLPHAFWAYIEAPESDDAFATMARFLTAQLGELKR